MKIKKNLGSLDRLIRTVISSAFVYIGFFDNPIIQDPIAGTALGVFGLANLVVVIIAYCPMYEVINFSTYKQSSS